MPHTKGPWTYDDYNQMVYSKDGKQICRLQLPYTGMPAYERRENPKKMKERAHNGLLISAATEMFEFISWYKNYCEETDDPVATPGYRTACEIMQYLRGKK